MVTAPPPAKLIPKSNIGISIWAMILQHKFAFYGFFGSKDPKHPLEIGFTQQGHEDQPAGFVTMPVVGAAIVLDEKLVERLKKRHEFLQTVGDGAGGGVAAIGCPGFPEIGKLGYVFIVVG